MVKLGGFLRRPLVTSMKVGFQLMEKCTYTILDMQSNG